MTGGRGYEAMGPIPRDQGRKTEATRQRQRDRGHDAEAPAPRGQGLGAEGVIFYYMMLYHMILYDVMS